MATYLSWAYLASSISLRGRWVFSQQVIVDIQASGRHQTRFNRSGLVRYEALGSQPVGKRARHVPTGSQRVAVRQVVGKNMVNIGQPGIRWAEVSWVINNNLIAC